MCYLEDNTILQTLTAGARCTPADVTNAGASCSAGESATGCSTQASVSTSLVKENTMLYVHSP